MKGFEAEEEKEDKEEAVGEEEKLFSFSSCVFLIIGH
jgi:hypothetical protein